jgi:hypothetical protein
MVPERRIGPFAGFRGKQSPTDCPGANGRQVGNAGYQQEKWVKVHRYQERQWNELITLWTALNQHLLVAAQSVPENSGTHTCSVGGSEPMTLQFVFEDYIEHMLHHLQHIGIGVADFAR